MLVITPALKLDGKHHSLFSMINSGELVHIEEPSPHLMGWGLYETNGVLSEPLVKTLNGQVTLANFIESNNPDSLIELFEVHLPNTNLTAELIYKLNKLFALQKEYIKQHLSNTAKLLQKRKFSIRVSIHGHTSFHCGRTSKVAAILFNDFGIRLSTGSPTSSGVYCDPTSKGFALDLITGSATQKLATGALMCSPALKAELFSIVTRSAVMSTDTNEAPKSSIEELQSLVHTQSEVIAKLRKDLDFLTQQTISMRQEITQLHNNAAPTFHRQNTSPYQPSNGIDCDNLMLRLQGLSAAGVEDVFLTLLMQGIKVCATIEQQRLLSGHLAALQMSTKWVVVICKAATNNSMQRSRF